MCRPALPGCGFSKHPTQCRAIYVPSTHTKADDPAGVLIHHDHYPVAFQQNGFTSKQVNAPQTVFGMANSSQPRWSSVAGIVFVLGSKYPSHNVFIQLQPECQVDLLSDARASVSGIALLHFDDGFDDFSGWSLWAGLSTTTGRI
jgi:hypothetical protein